MSYETVEAIFIWKYSKAPFSACYGRLPGTKYSKDFLQSPAEQFPEIDRSLGWDGEQVEFEFRWPGGLRTGYWRHSAADERGQLAWPASDAPSPWKVGDPSANEEISFIGDPSQTTEVGADAVFNQLNSSGVDPYIFAVKLRGQDHVLHARACMRNPPPGHEKRGVTELPGVLSDAILALSAGGSAIRLVIGAESRASALVNRILATLEHEPNILLTGPPGTGKTVALEDLRAAFERNSAELLFDPEKWDDAWQESKPMASETKVVSLVFHPSYGYENFVAGLVPAGGTGLSLKAQAGPLISLAHWASQGDRKALLILDEFNRGPAAAIFGDTLALLDGDKRDTAARPGSWITRPFPQENMTVAPEFERQDGEGVPDGHLKLPIGVKLVAAMNSTDRSVAPLDAALRRRFAIIPVGPDYRVLAERYAVDLPDAASPFDTNGEWTAGKVKQLALRLLMVINDRILDILGSDFLLGHALFWHVAGDSVESASSSLARAFDERVSSTLRITFADEDEALSAVLGIGEDQAEGSHVGYWRRPVGRLSQVASPRLVVQELSHVNDATAVLSRIVKVL